MIFSAHGVCVFFRFLLVRRQRRQWDTQPFVVHEHKIVCNQNASSSPSLSVLPLTSCDDRCLRGNRACTHHSFYSCAPNTVPRPSPYVRRPLSFVVWPRQPRTKPLCAHASAAVFAAIPSGKLPDLTTTFHYHHTVMLPNTPLALDFFMAHATKYGATFAHKVKGVRVPVVSVNKNKFI